MDSSGAPQTDVVDQAASFQRMIDAEKTIFLRTAASAATPDPALQTIETLRFNGIVIRDYAFAPTDLRFDGRHVEYRRQWEEQERQRIEQEEAAKDDMDDPPVRVVALYDYAGTELGHLPFKTGDIISVSENYGNGNLLGTLNGRMGLLPETYVRPASEEEAR